MEEPWQILLYMFSAVSMTAGAGQPKKSFNRVIVFADNAGADILLGILPLVRSDPVQLQQCARDILLTILALVWSSPVHIKNCTWYITLHAACRKYVRDALVGVL